MKKYYTCLIIILLFCSNYFSQEIIPADGMESRKENFKELASRPNPKISDELLKVSNGTIKNHPEFGILPLNAPCKDCYEVIEKRTEDSRHFVINGTNGNAFYNQTSLGAINYKNKNGLYLEKDINVYATSVAGIFESNHQAEPVTIDLNSKLVSIKTLDNFDIKINNQLELWGVDNDGKEQFISFANWSGATVGSSGVRVNDVFKGISLEAIVLSGSVKTNFIIDSYSSSYKGYKWLVIKDNINQGTDNRISFTSKPDGSGLYNCDADIISGINMLVGKVHQGIIYDQSRSNTSALYYKQNGSKLEIYIDADYLNADNTLYPVTVDPLVTSSATLAQASITGSQYNASCNFANSCDFNLMVNSPANATITDVTFSMSYQALGSCFQEDGAMRIGYGSCVSPNATGFYWYCNFIGTGTCAGTNISVYNDLASCLPAPGCSSVPMTFTLKMYRSCWGATGCTANCIRAASPWVMNVMSKTLETLSNTSTGDGTTTQTASCSGTVALDPSPLYGVGPYIYSWNPGGATTPGYTVTSVSSSQTITCNVTDACGVSRVATFSVNPNPSIPSASSVQTATISSCNPNVIFSPTYTSSSAITSYTWSGPGISGANNGPSVTVNQTGIYTASFTNSSGCTASNTYTAVIGPVTATASSQSATINCVSTSATLSPTYSPPNDLTYSWVTIGPGSISGSSTSSSVIVIQPGVYEVTLTNTITGCQNSTSYTVTNATQSPTISSLADQTITCTSPTVSIDPSYNPSSGLTYAWSGPSFSSSSASITVTQNGTYTVIALAANGCSTTAQYNVIDQSALPIVTIQGGTLTCSGPLTLSTTVNPGSGTYTYTWGGPGITSGTNSNTVTVNAGGNYSIAIANNFGCIASNTYSVINDSDIPVSSIVSSTINCINMTPTLSPVYTPSANLTYTWTTTTGAISGSINSPEAIVTQAGIYQVNFFNTVTNCRGVNTYTVTDDSQIPTASSVADQTITCTTPAATINPVYTPSTGLSYSWNGPGLSTNTASISVTQGGTYTVIVEAANSCTASAQYNVIDRSMLPSLSIQGGTLTCSGPITLNTTVMPSSSSYTYAWIGPGITGAANGSSINVNVTGNYTVSIINEFGCSASNTFSVSANQTIPLASTVSETINCISTTVTLSPVYTPSTNLTYTWTTTSGSISGATNNPDLVVSQSGVYEVNFLNTVSNCQGSKSFTVTGDTVVPRISPLPTQTITCMTPSTIINPTYTPSIGSTYSWSGPGLSATTGSVVVTQAGVYTVVATSVNGCTASIQYPIISNTTVVSASSQNTVLPCDASPAAIGVTVNPIDSYSYSWIGSGIVGATNTPVINVNAAGNYTVTITNAGGCSTSTIVNVMSQRVTAAFIPITSTGLAPFAVNFTNQSSNAMNYFWLFGDGNSSVTQHASNSYQSNGIYNVILIVSNGPCIDTAYGTINVEEPSTIEVPNVFTPNGDGANDFFNVKTTGMKDLELTIFNRWGVRLFSASGISVFWNGEVNGKTIPEGTYFYIVKAKGFDDKEYEKKGTINLFR
ncbi:MAG: gliding motility-associated C-terminal domain-containing protein [Bacteroidota bacterium]